MLALSHKAFREGWNFILPSLYNLEPTPSKPKLFHAGCSNYNVEQLRMALRFGHIDTLQPCYNLLTRGPEEDLFPLCMAEGISVLAYSTLQYGLLTGKFTGNETFTDLRAGNPMFQGDEFKKHVERVNRIRPIAGIDVQIRQE